MKVITEKRLRELLKLSYSGVSMGAFSRRNTGDNINLFKRKSK